MTRGCTYATLSLESEVFVMSEEHVKKNIDNVYPLGYNEGDLIIKETDIFKKWMRELKDRMARSIINARIRRLSLGNRGDTEYIADGVSELRINFGPGYRVYYIQVKKRIIILLCGGDKSSQNRDIEKAKHISSSLEELE